MAKDLVLVSLNDQQIAQAKAANGADQDITHAVVCGDHGVKFGTHEQCQKAYSFWGSVFSDIFDRTYVTQEYDLPTYDCSGDDLPDILKDKSKKH